MTIRMNYGGLPLRKENFLIERETETDYDN